MPRVCNVCSHPDRAAINRLLVAGSGTLRTIADEFGFSRSSLRRHFKHHVPAVLRVGASLSSANEAVELQAVAVRREAEPADLLAQLRSLFEESQRVLADAREAGDPRVVLLAV